METKAGKHAFDRPVRVPTGCVTFSVGVYEWVPTNDGKGLKKGKAKVRVVGLTSFPHEVYAKADEVVSELDAGTYRGPKTVSDTRVKG